MNKIGTITTAIGLDHKAYISLRMTASNVVTLNTKFGQLILRKIIKPDATRCQILKLKCIKFDFGWGAAPDPAGAYSTPPDPLAGFNGAYF